MTINIKNQTIAERIDRLFEEALTECNECQIKYGNITTVKLNNRQASWGLCKTNPNKTYTIELSRLLLEGTDEVVKETILHEICHTVEDGRGHKRGWLQAVSKLNARYGYTLTRCTSSEEKDIELPKGKYMIRCKNCGAEWQRMKETKVIKYPERYKCKCGGRIERV